MEQEPRPMQAEPLPNPPRSPLVRGEENRVPGKRRVFLPYDEALVSRARENRQNPTPAETLIWNKVLRHRQFQTYKFLRQKPIGSYIVDFHCAELRLVIEIDGDSHARQVEYDEARSEYLRGLGLDVIRYANREVLQNIEGVFLDLQNRIGIGNETGATQNAN
jgi:very-short-patch-repair endonuclease